MNGGNILKVINTNLRMTRGDSESFSITFHGYTPQPGDLVEFTVRRFISSDVILYKKVTKFEGNKAIIKIMPEDTEKLSFGDYVYDIQLTFSGAVKTIIKPSKFTIESEVTYGNRY